MLRLQTSSSKHDKKKFSGMGTTRLAQFLSTRRTSGDEMTLDVKQIVNGKQPIDLTIRKLRNLPALPYNWEEQRQLLGMPT